MRVRAKIIVLALFFGGFTNAALAGPGDLKDWVRQNLESLAIVDPQSPLAQEFSYQMGSMAQVMATKSRPRGLYFLSLEGQPVVRRLLYVEPEILIFSRGMLRQMRDLDSLAFVLAHELFEQQEAEIFGEPEFEDQALQLRADRWAAAQLPRIGLNPVGGIRLLKDLREDMWRTDAREVDERINELTIRLSRTQKMHQFFFGESFRPLPTSVEEARRLSEYSLSSGRPRYDEIQNHCQWNLRHLRRR